MPAAAVDTDMGWVLIALAVDGKSRKRPRRAKTLAMPHRSTRRSPVALELAAAVAAEVLWRQSRRAVAAVAAALDALDSCRRSWPLFAVAVDRMRFELGIVVALCTVVDLTPRAECERFGLAVVDTPMRMDTERPRQSESPRIAVAVVADEPEPVVAAAAADTSRKSEPTLAAVALASSDKRCPTMTVPCSSSRCSV